MNHTGKARLHGIAMCLTVIVLLLAGVRSNAQGVVPGRLLIKLAPGTSIVGVSLDFSLDLVDSVTGLNLYEVSVQNPLLESLTKLLLDLDPLVEYCEDEAYLASPELQADPFHLAFDSSSNSAAYSSQTAYQQVNMPNSTGSNNGGSADAANVPVTVAVLDTGVDLSNPALNKRLVNGYDTLKPSAAPLDVPDGQYNTVVGHGTMIAGLIARVSPNSVIMPIRVFNADGVGTAMHAIEGINYAVLHGARVINMSFETNINSIAITDALNQAYNAGAVLVASAGNEGTSTAYYPASYRNVIGVTSVDGNDKISSFSNYGVNTLLVAPGNGIRSTYWNGNFATWSGTSFAAPFVTAEAAEVLFRNQNWTAEQVMIKMLKTANNIDYLNPDYANMLGAGIIDINSAIGGQ